MSLVEHPYLHATSSNSKIPSIPLESTTEELLSSTEKSLSPEHGEGQKATPREFFFFLLKGSALWVLGGIGFMLAGIAIVQTVLLPRIYSCPSGATCPGSFNPQGNVLQLVQALMQYWLQIGTAIAAVGSIRLVAYQCWLIMMHKGNTIENLNLNLGAIKGSPYDAIRLLLKKDNRSLGLFTFAHVIITGIISLVVGFSIISAPGQLLINFLYPNILNLPNSSSTQLNNDGQVTAIGQLESWALTNRTSHGLVNGFSGTLVVPDNRTIFAVNPMPGGSRITGDISCTGALLGNVAIVPDGDNGVRYVISYGSKNYTALPNFLLATSLTSTDTAVTRYLWVSNTTDLLPNATTTEDGKMHLTHCNHTVRMVDIPREVEDGIQYIQPSVPIVGGCNSSDQGVCTADSVNNAILAWWGGLGTSLWKVSCRGGILGPLHNANEPCALDNSLWVSTLTGMLDAIVRTSPRSGNAVQQLQANIEARSAARWWLQAIVPGTTFLLYVVTLLYTVRLSKGQGDVKELDLGEVITAAQTDKMRTLVQAGSLRKSTSIGQRRLPP